MVKCSHPVEGEFYLWERWCGFCGTIFETIVRGSSGESDFHIPESPNRTGNSNKTYYFAYQEKT